MPKPGQLVVAMSGGVDSSTAAAWLKEQGYEVIGLTMQLWDYQREESAHPAGEARHSGTCCSLDDVHDARRVAHFLNIPFYVVNLEKEFEKAVVVPFLQSYLQGQTPIPCIACNTFLKFDNLLLKARQLGASGLATGHYARIQHNSSTGRLELLRGIDRAKDQSYFLFELTQGQMKRIRFPLGAFTKTQIREMAARQGLPVSEKAESQEICFIPHNDYGLFIEKYISTHPQTFPSDAMPGKGEIVDVSGKVLGEHEGFYHYTVGQRKGLRVAAGHPLYVLETHSSDNRVIVGSGEKLLKKGLTANNLNWIAIDKLSAPLQVSAKIRNRHEAAPGTIYPLDENRVYLEFDQPQRAITPGQAAVFYAGDLVIGGGWIQESR